MKRYIITIMLGLLVAAKPTLAHCPLCTVGAGAAAGLALYLGVSPLTIGLFIGAFALALGLWIGRVVRWRLPYKKSVFGAVSLVGTTLPLVPLVPGYTSFSIYWSGDYGSLLNRTYLVPVFLMGSAIGALILLAAPYLSYAVTKLRQGRTLPYQGISLTFLLLIGLGVIFELVL